MHLESKILHPLLKCRVAVDFTLDVDQVAVKSAFLSDRYQEQRKLFGCQHILRVIGSLGDESSQALRTVAFAGHSPVPGRDCDVMVGKIVEDFCLF